MDKKMIDDDPELLEAEMARLADGSLPAARQAELREELQRSPALARALAEQEQAVSMLRAADVPAPDSLRQWLQEQTSERRAPRRRLRLRPRFAFPAAAGVAVAAVAAAIVLALSGGSTSPSLTQATRASLAASTMPPPSESNDGAMTLDVSAAGIRFPYWEKTIGWRALGFRVDSLSGRHAVTVFYAGPAGHRVGYTIVTGPPLNVSGGKTVTSHGIPYTFKQVGSARMVTWLRNGHTCVIAGRGVSNPMLLHLATADIPA